MEPSNDARLRASSLYAPICNYTKVKTKDKKRNIWKGCRVIEPGSPKDQVLIIYFSREYHPNDYLNDKILTEIEFNGEEIIGFPFMLIPKEKILFSYDPPSALIVKPAIRLTEPRKFQ